MNSVAPAWPSASYSGFHCMEIRGGKAVVTRSVYSWRQGQVSYFVDDALARKLGYLHGWSQSMRRRWRKAHPERVRHESTHDSDCCRHCGASGIQIVNHKVPRICPARPHP